jgi:hypothetical protein
LESLRSLYPSRKRVAAAAATGKTSRAKLGCANQAHGFAACCAEDKALLRIGEAANLAIVTAYNDMLSAHQSYERFPELIRAAAREVGGVAQVAVRPAPPVSEIILPYVRIQGVTSIGQVAFVRAGSSIADIPLNHPIYKGVKGPVLVL